MGPIPMAMMSAMAQPPVPYCKKITRNTTNKGRISKHVAFADIPEGFATMYKALNYSEDNIHAMGISSVCFLLMLFFTVYFTVEFETKFVIQ